MGAARRPAHHDRAMKNQQILTAARHAGSALLMLVGALTLQAADTSPTNSSPRTTPSQQRDDNTVRGTGNASGMGMAGDSNKSYMDTAQSGELAHGDRKFLEKVAKLGQEELALSRVAADRATNPQVRAFAADMVREHTSANSEITALAQRKGVALAADGAQDRQKTESKWTDKPVGGFDEDYVDAAISNHKKTIDELEDAVDSKDPEIAALANKLLPTVRAHLAHAQNLQKSLK
jgi:putative membrane protein